MYNNSTTVKSHVLLKIHQLHSFPFGEETGNWEGTGKDELALETLEKMRTRDWKLLENSAWIPVEDVIENPSRAASRLLPPFPGETSSQWRQASGVRTELQASSKGPLLLPSLPCGDSLYTLSTLPQSGLWTRAVVPFLLPMLPGGVFFEN